MKLTSFLRWSSLAATLALGPLIFYILLGYHEFVKRPGQGGWDFYRFCEIGLRLAPLILLFISLLVSRAERMSRRGRFGAAAALVISAPFALWFSGGFILLVAAALLLHFLYVGSDSGSPHPAGVRHTLGL